jgi:Lipopolysaccharide-assembly
MKSLINHIKDTKTLQSIFGFKSCDYSAKTYLSFRNSIPFFLFIITILGIFDGCGVYSFTGSSVPPHLKTIAIPISEDKSGSGEPGLRENLTNTLIQDFIDDNSLQVSNKNDANSLLECTITSLSDAPNIVSAGEQVTSRSITIKVSAVFKDLVKHKTVFQKTFSESSNYTPSSNPTIRENAISDAISKLSEDILLDVVSGW